MESQLSILPLGEALNERGGWPSLVFWGHGVKEESLTINTLQMSGKFIGETRAATLNEKWEMGEV
jgi:hypothetical protein